MSIVNDIVGLGELNLNTKNEKNNFLMVTYYQLSV